MKLKKNEKNILIGSLSIIGLGTILGTSLAIAGNTKTEIIDNTLVKNNSDMNENNISNSGSEKEEGNLPRIFTGTVLDGAAVKSLGWDTRTSILRSDWNDAPNVTTIGDRALSFSTRLTSVYIPSRITTLGTHAFSYCRNLTTVEFEPLSQLAIISFAAFMEAGLTSIVIPDTVTTINNWAFQKNPLRSISFGSNSRLAIIGNEVFEGTSIGAIDVPNSVTSIGTNAFKNTPSLDGRNVSMPIALQKGSSPALYGFTQTQWDRINWKHPASTPFLGTILTPEAVTSIGWDTKTSIALADWTEWAPNVTKIGDNAFKNKTALKGIIIPSKITEIGDSSFAGTTSLTNVVFQANARVIRIKNYAFQNSGFESFTLPDSVLEIGMGTFSSNSLKTMIINRTSILNTIGDEAFWAPNLQSIYIPDSVTTIVGNAFKNTTSLMGDQVSMLITLRNNSDTPRFGFTQTQWNAINWRPVVFTGTVLTAADVANLRWNLKSTITFSDWRTWAPNVTQIGLNAFQDQTRLAGIEIPAKVTTIDNAAFQRTSNLKNVTFETNSQLTRIGNQGFHDSGFQRFTLPDSVTSIGFGSFSSGNLRTIIINPTSKLTTIGDEAFWAPNLQSIYVPDSVTSIGSRSFFSTDSLVGDQVSMLITLQNGSSIPRFGFTQTQWNHIRWRPVPFTGTVLNVADVVNLWWDIKETITLADWRTWAPNVTQIGVGAFQNRTRLTSIEIPAKITSIGNSAFQRASSLFTVVFEGSSQLTTIGNQAFLDSRVETVIVPDSVTSVGLESFSSVFLKTITFSETSRLTTIGDRAFWSPNIQSIYVPDSVISIGNQSFLGTTSLLGSQVSMSITLQNGSTTPLYGFTQTQWDRINWRVVQFTGTILTAADVVNLGWNTKTSITLADWRTWAPNVTQIGLNAFQDKTSLTGIEIPAKVTVIDNGAFQRTSNLKNVTFEPNSRLITIGDHGFNNSGFETFTLPDSVTSIGWGSFSSLVLRIMTINPTSKLTTIGDEAFWSFKLQSIYIPNSVTTIHPRSFFGTTALMGNQVSMSITLRKNSLTPLYGFTQAQWDTINWRVEPFMGTVLLNADAASLGWQSQASITLADFATLAPNVIELGNSVFNNNSVLTSIEIPDKVTKISSEAFHSTVNLRTATISSTSQLKSIGNFAFQSSKITSINIPDSLTSIGNLAFKSTTNLTTITIGANSQLTSIGEWCFDISAISSINIPNGITSIQQGTFTNTSNLRSIVFGIDSKLASIDRKAFENSGITAINLPNSLTTIGDSAFAGTTNLEGRNVSMRIALKQNSAAPLYGFTQEQWDTIDWRVEPFLGTILTKTDVQGLNWDKKTSITLDDWSLLAPNVTQIGERDGILVQAPFASNITLSSINIPAKVTSIGNNAFLSTSFLTSIVFEANSQLKTIGNNAFQYSAIETINIPEGVTSISSEAFRGSSFLNAVYVPDSVTTIGNQAFAETPLLFGPGISMLSTLRQNSTTPLYGFTQLQWDNISWRPVQFTGIVLTMSEAINLGWNKKAEITLQDWIDLAPNVTEIDGAFLDNKILRSIAISAKITNIYSSAFKNTTSLASVTFGIASKLTTIGNGSFQGSTINQIEIPSLVTSIDINAFQGSSLTSINITKSITSIGVGAFQNTNSLREITFETDSKLSIIGDNAFSGSGITSINVPNSVTTIGTNAFANTEASLPGENISMLSTLRQGSITPLYGFTQTQWDNISWRAIPFTGTILTLSAAIDLGWNRKTTISLQEWINLAPNVVEISEAFTNNKTLEVIEIPGKLTKISPNSFADTTALKIITFAAGSQLTTIDLNAFKSSGITSINIPNSVTTIGIGAFENTRSLERVVFDDGSPLKTIGDNSFKNSSVRSINLPKLTSIGTNVFQNSDLTSINIPNSVISIGVGAFENTNLLTTITFEVEATIETIGDNAFSRSKITEIHIPNSVTSIGVNAFLSTDSLPGNKVSMLSTLRQGSITPLYGFTEAQWGSIDWRPVPFEGTILNKVDVINLAWDKKTTITLNDWTTYAPKVVEINGAFSENKAIKSIVIPAKLTKINTNSFFRATALTSVTFEANSQLNMMGDQAFQGSGITSIAIPPLVTTLGIESFDNTIALKSISFAKTGSKLTTIQDRAFKSSGIATINIPNSVTSIGVGAFQDTTSLTSLAFEADSQLTNIGVSAFQSSVITWIDVPNSVTTIGDNAFTNTSATLPGTNISMLSTLRKNSSLPLYGFTQAQWDDINWRAIPFEGTVLTKDEAINLAWDKKTTITLEDWTNLAPKVTKIDKAFENNKILQSIFIPSKIATISPASFSGTTALTTITFAANSQLTLIDNNTFLGSSLTAIEVPDSVTKIGDGAFQDTTTLSTITFGTDSQLKIIGNNSFQNSGIKSIYVPNGVTSIGIGAFTSTTLLPGRDISMLVSLKQNSITPLYGFTQIQWNAIDWRITPFEGQVLTKTVAQDLGWDTVASISLEDWTKYANNVIEIQGAFESNSVLQSIVLPAKLTIISSSSFANTTFLSSVAFDLGSQLVTIGNNAFQNSSLTTIAIPDLVTSIGSGAFQSTPNLKTVTFGLDSKLATIGVNAFQGSGLNSIIIPNSVKSIGTSSFQNTASLETVTIKNDSQLTTIGENAFNGSAITSIYIPNLVTTIGDNAFQGTKALLGNQVSMLLTLKQESATPLYGFTQTQWDSIDWRAVPFLGQVLTKQDVLNLKWHENTSITLADWQKWAPNVVKIGADVTDPTSAPFSDNNKLQSIEIPSKITDINYAAFLGATALTTVTFESNSQLAFIGNSAFQNSNISSITIPQLVTNIGSDAFNGTRALTTANFTDNSKLANLGARAFQDSAIVSIYIPDLVTTINIDTFKGTQALKTVTFGSNSQLAVVGEGAFQNSGLTSITLPLSVALIELNAFNNATSLATVIFNAKSQLTLIGVGAFSNTAIAAITIPNTVEVIGDSAFFKVITLKEINFVTNSQLTSIGVSAFQETGITSITVPDSVTSIGIDAFKGTTSLQGEQVSMMIELRQGSEVPLYGFTQTQWNAIAWRGIVTLTDTITESFFVEFQERSNIVEMPELKWVASTNMTEDALKGGLGLQYAIGTAENNLIIDWGNATEIKARITEYSKTKDILKSQLNIFARMYLPLGTGPEGNMIGNLKYIWNKEVVKIYDNVSGIINNFFVDPGTTNVVAPGQFIRTYSKVESTWAESLSAEGNKSTAVKIFSLGDSFNLIYYAQRGIKLEVSPDAGATWTKITAFNTQEFDASKTNIMQFRLSVEDAILHEIYGTVQTGTTPTGIQTPVIQKDIIAKIELTGVTADDLTTNKLVVSGTTHNLTIVESDELYTVSGMDVATAKTFFEIKYTYDGVNYFTKDAFISDLNKLRSQKLNALNLANFKVRYEFTTLGLNTYYSTQVANDAEVTPSDVTKQLNTSNVVKTFDIALEIADITNIKLMGSTENITWSNVDSLNEISRFVKVEYGRYVKSATEEITYEWSTTRPSSIYSTSIPGPGFNNYPLAIRFLPLTPEEKVEIGSIDESSTFIPSNVELGYEVDLSKLVTIINIDTTLLVNELILTGYANNLNDGATPEIIEAKALNLVDPTFRNDVQLKYQISILPGEWYSLTELREKMSAYKANFANLTSGIMIFDNGVIPGVTIDAQFVPKDPLKFVVVATPSATTKLNTSGIKTNIDLRSYVQVLQTQKVIPSGATATDLGTLTLPSMTEGNVLFGGRTYDAIVDILKSSIKMEFKAPGFHGDNWVALSEIKSVNVNNDLYIRFVVDEAAKANIELSLVEENDYEKHLLNGFKLIIDLPIEIQVNSKDLINYIKLSGNTKNLRIDDTQVYEELVATDPTYVGKVQVLYTIGKTPMALDPTNPEKIEFTKDEIIALLVNNTIDITMLEKQITAKYALADGVSPSEYKIKDPASVNLIVEPVLLFINKSNYYELASLLTVSGTSDKIIWGPQLGDLLNVLSLGLTIQYSTDPAAVATDPTDSPKWSTIQPTAIDPNIKFLVVRLVTNAGYVFEELPQMFNVNTDNVLLIMELKNLWLESVLITGNTKDILINTTNFEQILTEQGVPGKEFVVVQYYFGGTVPSGVTGIAPGTEWFTADQLKLVLAALRGAKNDRELILFRNSFKARYSLTEEGYKNYRISIDGKFIEQQFPTDLSDFVDLVTDVLNPELKGYINLDLVNTFTPDNFAIKGTNISPELQTNDQISQMLQYYTNQTTTPFDIYFTNQEGNFTNTNWKLFGEGGFITTFPKDFEIKLNVEGKALPIWFKIVARPTYEIWEKDAKLENGKIIQITNIDIQPQVVNPLTKAPDIRFSGYQGQGTMSVYVSGTETLVTPGYLNPDVPGVLKLVYNVSDSLYRTEELSAIINDETKWVDAIPTNLRVGQYVMTKVAIANPEFTMVGGDAMTPPTRVRGLKVHADTLSVSPDLILTNTDWYGYPALDGQAKIDVAKLVVDELGNYLGADLQMSVDLEFYKDVAGNIILDANDIPIVKRNPEGATTSSNYKDAEGKDILDATGKPIPVWTINKGDSIIPAPPLSTGVWKTPEKMNDGSVQGTFSQNDSGLLDWRLFEGQTVKFSFIARVGEGDIDQPDFIFDDTIPKEQEIVLSKIRYIIPTNGINYRFDEEQLKNIKYASDDGDDDSYTGASHISSQISVIRMADFKEEQLEGVNIQNQVKKDFDGKIQVEMQLISKNGIPSPVVIGTDISQIKKLENGDTITISFKSTDPNFLLPKPITPLTIIVKGLRVKPLDQNLFKYLRPNFTGLLNGSGSFNIRVTNPNNPTETNDKQLGSDQWYEYQVWNADRTLKTTWTKDETKINNLVNGDKVEWKLVNKFGTFKEDYYNTLLANTSTTNDIKFRVVNVVGKNEQTYEDGIGNSSLINPNNPDGTANYPAHSGWVVSGLKVEISLGSIQQAKFEEQLRSFKPTFSGVNKFGSLNSNISNIDPISPDVVLVWWTSSEGGAPRKITDFREAGLSNGDKVWASIAPSSEAIENDLILDQSIASMSSEVFTVSGLTILVNSSTQTLIISLITASSVLLVGVVGLMVFIKKNGKLKNNRKF